MKKIILLILLFTVVELSQFDRLSIDLLCKSNSQIKEKRYNLINNKIILLILLIIILFFIFLFVKILFIYWVIAFTYVNQETADRTG